MLTFLPSLCELVWGGRLTFQLGSLHLERPLRVARFAPVDNLELSSRSRGPSKTAFCELKPAFQPLPGS
jgi:hypothetical protein